jgi:hypothetical protein
MFGRDMLFDLSFTIDYKDIKKSKQEDSYANTNGLNSKKLSLNITEINATYIWKRHAF